MRADEAGYPWRKTVSMYPALPFTNPITLWLYPSKINATSREEVECPQQNPAWDSTPWLEGHLVVRNGSEEEEDTRVDRWAMGREDGWATDRRERLGCYLLRVLADVGQIMRVHQGRYRNGTIQECGFTTFRCGCRPPILAVKALLRPNPHGTGNVGALT
jgi:hypothetical protein